MNDMTDGIDRDAILAKPPIDSLLNSGAVEAPVGPVEGTEGTEPVRDWERIAQEAQEALSRAQKEHDAFKLRVRAVATWGAKQHDLCSTVDTWMAKLGPDMGRLTEAKDSVTLTLKVTMPVTRGEEQARTIRNACEGLRNVTNAMRYGDVSETALNRIKRDYGLTEFTFGFSMTPGPDVPTVASVLGAEYDD